MVQYERGGGGWRSHFVGPYSLFHLTLVLDYIILSRPSSPGILGFEMEKNNIKLKISESVQNDLLYYL